MCGTEQGSVPDSRDNPNLEELLIMHTSDMNLSMVREMIESRRKYIYERGGIHGEAHLKRMNRQKEVEERAVFKYPDIKRAKRAGDYEEARRIEKYERMRFKMP